MTRWWFVQTIFLELFTLKKLWRKQSTYTLSAYLLNLGFFGKNKKRTTMGDRHVIIDTILWDGNCQPTIQKKWLKKGRYFFLGQIFGIVPYTLSLLKKIVGFENCNSLKVKPVAGDLSVLPRFWLERRYARYADVFLVDQFWPLNIHVKTGWVLKMLIPPFLGGRGQFQCAFYLPKDDLFWSGLVFFSVTAPKKNTQTTASQRICVFLFFKT